MRHLPRLLKIAAQRTTRNPYNAVAAVFVLFLAFFISGAFALMTLGSSQLLSYFESRPQVTAFLKDGTTSSQVKSIQENLEESGLVAKTKYVSKEEALDIYKARFSDEPLLTAAVTADILPASIEVSTHKLSDLTAVADDLGKDQSVEEVVFQRNIVETLQAWANAVRNIGGGVVVFLLLTSFLITLIVIGLNISLHKDEIEIMRLVGAGSWYVRVPFILEGVFYGVFSALAATLVLWGLFAWASPALQNAFLGIPILEAKLQVFVWLLIAEIFGGAIIGSIGSFVATRKYLDV